MGLLEPVHVPPTVLAPQESNSSGFVEEENEIENHRETVDLSELSD